MQLPKAIWLLFLDTNKSLEQFFTYINIPFDCQFLVAQSQSDHVVVLTEVYHVSPTLPLQTYRFGNWTADGGLTWPSQDLYTRRNNLTGLLLKAGFMNVRVSYTHLHLSLVDKGTLQSLPSCHNPSYTFTWEFASYILMPSSSLLNYFVLLCAISKYLWGLTATHFSVSLLSTLLYHCINLLCWMSQILPFCFPSVFPKSIPFYACCRE